MSEMQPDQHPAIQEFLNFIENQRLQGTRVADPEADRSFVPDPALNAYFDDHRVTRLLWALFPEGDFPAQPEDIRRNCLKIFSILLLIGKGNFIGSFVQHEGLWDQRLPFDPSREPRNFPKSTTNPQFFAIFCQKQWKFCAPTFRFSRTGVTFEKERILPIVQKERLSGGGSAFVHKIVLHEAHNDLVPRDGRQEVFSRPCRGIHSTD